MGDMGDVFNAHKQANKDRKAKRLAEADSEGWKKHTPWHWSMFLHHNKIDYYPSTGLVMYCGKKMNIKSNRAKDLIKEAKADK